MLGGHAAERTALEDISTGASSDIKRATELARRMVTQWGMSDTIGTMYLGSDQDVFVGMEFGQSREYSEQSAATIDAEVKRLIDICYQRACELLTENRDRLVAVAEALLDRDTLNRKEFEMVMNGEELPPKTEAEALQPTESEEEPAVEEQQETNVFETVKQDDEEPFVEPGEEDK